MTTPGAGFTGSVPANYDRYLRPFLFEPYANDLAERIMWQPNMRILETACGTGVLTERIQRDHAAVTATDLNAAMVDYAKARLPQASVTWQAADALKLPFEDHSFDVVICQFGWMFFPDKAAGAREAHRVLVSEGQLLFNVWESIERNEVANVIQQSVHKLYGDSAPTFLQTPYGYHDPKAIRTLLVEAGFNEIRIEPVQLIGICPSAEDVAHGYVEGTPMSIEIAARGPNALREAVEQATKDVAARFGDGPVRVTHHALVCSAIAV